MSERGELAVLLAAAYRVTVDDLHRHLATVGHPGLRPAHGFAFWYLSHHADATVVELAAHLGVTKQAGAQLADELDRLGYVTRGAHPRDRRARTVRLTAKGRDCIERVVAYWTDRERRWAEQVGADELATVRAALQAYVADAPTGLKPRW